MLAGFRGVACLAFAATVGPSGVALDCGEVDLRRSEMTGRAVDIAVDNFVDIDSVTGIFVWSLAPLLTTALPRSRAENSAQQCLNRDCVSRETRITLRATSSAGENSPVLVGFCGILALSRSLSLGCDRAYSH